MRRKKPEIIGDHIDVEQLSRDVQFLAKTVKDLGVILDEIREDLIYAVRNTGLDPSVSRAEHQRFLDQVAEGIVEMEEQDAPIGTKKTFTVEPLPVKPTGTLFE